jgi:glycosyltransferase involved in cell wall biosynthesis
LYPAAFEQFDFSEYDLVISQTTRFAKSIITKPETLHICYMHTPPRFLWNFSGEDFPFILKPLLWWFQLFDKVSGVRPDFYLAGSKNAAQRISSVYNSKSEVLYPFVDLEKYSGVEVFDGGYYLVISRLNKYKNVDVIVKACKELGKLLKVVGRGNQLNTIKAEAGAGIEFLQGLSDEMLIEVIAGCRALIVAAEEDFGLTPLEAQAIGKPIIALKKGGALETVVENKTGIFFENPTVKELAEVIERFEEMRFNPEDCIAQAKKFSKNIFLERLSGLVEKCSQTKLY